MVGGSVQDGGKNGEMERRRKRLELDSVKCVVMCWMD